MKLAVTMLLAMIVSVGSAHAEYPNLHVWTDGVLARLPFQDGKLDRESYRLFASSYVEQNKVYFDEVFGGLLEKAVRNGLTARADALRQNHERRISDLVINVDLATENIFNALDPDHKGVVWRSEARTIIYGYAKAADLDNNGHLDPDEQALAEWALSTGNTIADKADALGIRRQLLEVERYP